MWPDSPLLHVLCTVCTFLEKVFFKPLVRVGSGTVWKVESGYGMIRKGSGSVLQHYRSNINLTALEVGFVMMSSSHKTGNKIILWLSSIKVLCWSGALICWKQYGKINSKLFHATAYLFQSKKLYVPHFEAGLSSFVKKKEKECSNTRVHLISFYSLREALHVIQSASKLKCLVHCHKAKMSLQKYRAGINFLSRKLRFN